MHGATEISLYAFLSVYILLLVVIAIMKKAQIHQSKALIYGSIRMTFQLVLAGFVLTYLFENPHPAFTSIYFVGMLSFALVNILSGQGYYSKEFRLFVGIAFVVSACIISSFFVIVVTKQSFFNPQYTIPIAGMLVGNAMTGFNLALKSLHEGLLGGKNRIRNLLMLGVHPHKILVPFMSKALETALVPTINSMVGMGIISLPGMLTGQILSGTLPNTAILYQIAIMIAISSMVCMSVFFGLYLGIKTFYNHRQQILWV